MHTSGVQMVVLAPKTPKPLPPPRRLRDHRDIKRELSRLYRGALAGRIDGQLLGRLVHLLATLASLLRDVELEARLAALEEQASGEAWPGPVRQFGPPPVNDHGKRH
jgi:hypothetical protein